MSYTTKNIAYFDIPGSSNTEDCVDLAINRAKELGISTIIVASSTGRTAHKFYEKMKGSELKLVVVTHVMGFTSPGTWEFSQSIADELRSNGVTIVTGTHALSGLERAISKNANIGGGSRSEAIAEAFRRIIAVGLKVAVECTLIATDNGAVSINEEVIAVGGTIEGSDTVLVIKPSYTHSFFNLQVREVVAMPRNR